MNENSGSATIEGETDRMVATKVDSNSSWSFLAYKCDLTVNVLSVAYITAYTTRLLSVLALKKFSSCRLLGSEGFGVHVDTLLYSMLLVEVATQHLFTLVTLESNSI